MTTFEHIADVENEPIIPPPEEAELELVPGAEPEAQTQWQLVRRRFLRHKAAVISLVVLIIIFVLCFGAKWIAPWTWFGLRQPGSPWAARRMPAPV